jgi:RNA polymerase sigma-70 factor, ECF subfamily
MEHEVTQLLSRGRHDAAFERLTPLFQTKVYRLVVSMIRNEARAEEVTQDIFVKVWQALPAYDGRASLSTWIYTIARNTALTHLRSEKYREAKPLEQAREASTTPSRAGLEVERLLARLPGEQREVVELFYLQDLSIEDVAAMLEMPEGTIKSQLHRARKAMAAMMEGK